MKIFYSDKIELPLPDGHRFPLHKYTLLRKRVQAATLVTTENILVPEAATDEQLLRAHNPDYIHHVMHGKLSEKEIRRIGFPWSIGLVERSKRSVGGTIAACRAAFEDGFAINLAGGTHHAYSDHGEGYCVFNDCAVAARVMQAEDRAQRIIILDCDVHQGNGTAAIFQSDPTVFTFSIHGAKNFPFHKEASDLDIALPDETTDKDYLEALNGSVQHIFESFKADLVIYLAGADPFKGDQLGRLSLSKAGLAARDRLVFNQCHRSGLPIAVVMSGGYARIIEDTTDIHFQTVQIAEEVSRQ
jgi:acetoin utilization deacetylase AcuC-like enzyme